MMTRHPLSAAFPDMPAQELEALAQDVATHGLVQPIITLGGQVLDGWHRYLACDMAGVEPRTVELDRSVDPAAYVLSANLSRRHLTASQRAAAVVACAQWADRGRPRKQAPGAYLPSTEEQLAEIADVSRSTIRDAKAAARAGRGEEVRDGAVSARAAAGRAPSKKAEEEVSDERARDIAEHYESLLAIVEADNQLEAAWAEVRVLRVKLEQIERLYQTQRRELAAALRDAAKWKRVAETRKRDAGPT